MEFAININAFERNNTSICFISIKTEIFDVGTNLVPFNMGTKNMQLLLGLLFVFPPLFVCSFI